MKILSAIPFLLLIFSFVGCKKDDYPTPNGKRLEKIIGRWYDTVYYTFFKYDQDDRVVEVIRNNNNVPLDTGFLSIEYNSQGKMVNYRSKYNRSSFSYAYTFIYDTNGRITQKRSLPTNSPSKSYSYDQEGRLVTDSNFYYSLNSSILSGVYQYDNKGDLVKWQNQYYDSYNQRVFTWPVTEASYNNSLNSLADLGQILYHILEYYPYILSKHNVSQINYNNGSLDRSFTYEYYPNGLMKKIIYDNNNKFYDEFLYE